MAEPVQFVGYEADGSRAQFVELQEGTTFYLTHDETRHRMVNLQKRGAPCEQTAQALAAWPTLP